MDGTAGLASSLVREHERRLFHGESSPNPDLFSLVAALPSLILGRRSSAPRLLAMPFPSSSASILPLSSLLMGLRAAILAECDAATLAVACRVSFESLETASRHLYDRVEITSLKQGALLF